MTNCACAWTRHAELELFGSVFLDSGFARIPIWDLASSPKRNRRLAVIAAVLYEAAFAAVAIWFDRMRAKALSALTWSPSFRAPYSCPLRSAATARGLVLDRHARSGCPDDVGSDSRSGHALAWREWIITWFGAPDCSDVPMPPGACSRLRTRSTPTPGPWLAHTNLSTPASR